MSIDQSTLDSYQQFQLERYGNILPENQPLSESFEDGIEELNRLAEWIDSSAEQQLFNHD